MPARLWPCISYSLLRALTQRTKLGMFRSENLLTRPLLIERTQRNN
jgi:hypothetical protein